MIPSLDCLIQDPRVKVFISATKPESGFYAGPWSDSLLAELGGFSKFLLSQEDVKNKPEVVALAFWFRLSALKKLQTSYHHLKGEKPLSRPKRSFHIAPANVDTVYFYSLILAVLAGNVTVVRLSQRSGELTALLTNLLLRYFTFKPDNLLTNYINVVTYDSKHCDITETLSQWCDLRIIWGGDDAISAISAIAVDTPQICFPDRYSIAVMHLHEQVDLNNAVNLFIRDYLPFKQQACSSPKAVFWWQTSKELQALFWALLSASLQAEHADNFDDSDGLARFSSMQSIMLEHDGIVTEQVDYQSHYHCYYLDKVSPAVLKAHQGHGLLFCSAITSLRDLPLSDNLQTLTTYNLDNEIKGGLERQLSLDKIKRITGLGSALEFSHIWDGNDLVEIFSA